MMYTFQLTNLELTLSRPQVGKEYLKKKKENRKILTLFSCILCLFPLSISLCFHFAVLFVSFSSLPTSSAVVSFNLVRAHSSILTYTTKTSPLHSIYHLNPHFTLAPEFLSLSVSTSSPCFQVRKARVKCKLDSMGFEG